MIPLTALINGTCGQFPASAPCHSSWVPRGPFPDGAPYPTGLLEEPLIDRKLQGIGVNNGWYLTAGLNGDFVWLRITVYLPGGHDFVIGGSRIICQ